MRNVGHTVWAIPGGRMPLLSNGREPENTSRDSLSILNAGDGEARLEITLFYADRDPVGPYRLTVPGRRVRQVRLNDFINPEAIPLDTDYACLLVSDVAVVVQFTRKDTSQAENAIATTMAFPAPG